MTKPRSKTPIESFGAELFTALIEGSKRRIEIKTDYKTAIRVRLRIHQLRQRMREESHPMYGIAAKTVVTIDLPDDVETYLNRKKMKFPKDTSVPVILAFAPQDSNFAELFRKAGLDIKPIDHETINQDTNPTDTGSTTNTILEDLLKDFK